jgi:signal transduction histidine kinase
MKETDLKARMRKLGVSVVLPLVVKHEAIGFVIIKAKLSGEFYSFQDIRVFELLMPQLAISIRNARSFEEIKNFNIKLKEEVNKATYDVKQANVRLKELDKLKDEFVSIASHELRTPLTAIKSYLWMLLAGKAGKMAGKQSLYVERCFQSTERLIKLVNDMLNVSRIESGRVALEVKETDLELLALEVMEEVKPRAKELGLNLELAKEKETVGKKFVVAADPDKIREVMINLIGNSLKFTPKGGTISISLETRGDKIVTRIIDTGVGISKRHLRELFQKFGLIEGSYQVNQEATQGTGLGLYICKSIIYLHKGQIWADSPGEGKGTVFSFSLPRYTKDAYAQLLKENRNKTDVGIVHTTI